VRRTQLYLDDDLWNALHVRAREQGTTISDLVRQAARERYLDKLEGRREAMQAFVGITNERPDLADSTKYIRELRRGTRIQRLRKP
jgi:hypothetical protein